MFCVAVIICGHEIAVKCAMALLFISTNNKDVCVLTRFDVANVDCTCFV